MQQNSNQTPQKYMFHQISLLNCLIQRKSLYSTRTVTKRSIPHKINEHSRSQHQRNQFHRQSQNINHHLPIHLEQNREKEFFTLVKRVQFDKSRQTPKSQRKQKNKTNHSQNYLNHKSYQSQKVSITQLVLVPILI